MKPEFKKLCLEDKNSVEKILFLKNNINSESAFGTSYIWKDVYDIKICIYNNIFLKKIGNCYAFPKGVKTSEELKEIIELLKENSKSFELTELLKSEVEKLEKIFPGKFEFNMNRSDCEYIYSIEDLANLVGKKYHSKRNHIAKFNKLYNWNYFSEINIDECFNFFKKWFKLETNKENIYNINEYTAIETALKNFKALELCSGVVKVDGNTVACTIGERINKDVLLVHFEKAFSNFEGAYSLINNEFCKNQVNNFKLVNREEDMGISGLRKSKLSYKPKILLKKYTAKWKEFL